MPLMSEYEPLCLFPFPDTALKKISNKFYPYQNNPISPWNIYHYPLVAKSEISQNVIQFINLSLKFIPNRIMLQFFYESLTKSSDC